MSEQDSLNKQQWSEPYFSGPRTGFSGNNIDAKDWAPLAHGKNKFGLLDVSDKMPPAPASLDDMEGLLHKSAFGLNNAVHQAFATEDIRNPGQMFTASGSNGDMAEYIGGVVQGTIDATKIVDTSTLVNEPAVKEVLPEMALVELYADYGKIHDPRVPGGITRDDLQAYSKSCSSGNPLRKIAVDYALGHFDKIRQLDGDSPNITKAALEDGLKMFGKAESIKTGLQHRREPDEDVLRYLNDTFDKIRDSRFPGISRFDLQRHFSGDCKSESNEKVLEEFDQIRDMDEADGDRDYQDLWLTRKNSDDITRSDVSTGLASIAYDRAQMHDIQSLFDDWAK
ncbi:MAG: hypothetical protein KGS72_23925 [Cyanobacteria bacterium REEB67]|nr:hypothetical protein [Cyanobacteria bacterium REEB67]